MLDSFLYLSLSRKDFTLHYICFVCIFMQFIEYLENSRFIGFNEDREIQFLEKYSKSP